MQTTCEKCNQPGHVDSAGDCRMCEQGTPAKRTWTQLAQEAIDIQNACNIRGVSKSFATVVDEVADLIAVDAKANPISFNRHENVQLHPVVRMWASKIHDMTHMGLSDLDAFHEAYEWCKNKVTAAD